MAAGNDKLSTLQITCSVRLRIKMIENNTK